MIISVSPNNQFMQVGHHFYLDFSLFHCFTLLLQPIYHMFLYHPFYFDFHSARVIFDVSSSVSISGTLTGLKRDICQKCSRLLLKTQVPKIVNLPTEPYFL